MKRIKILLVHGTFARHALWDDCREVGETDSPFVSRLREGLSERGVAPVFEPFRWTGENSHQARRTAALRLNQRINKDAGEAAREDGLFIIGHSHGGTIARLAVNLDPSDIDPDGVITLGSPFVRFQPRPVRALFGALVWSVRAILLCALAITGFFIAITNGNGALVWAAGGLAVLVVGVFIDWRLRKARDRLVETQTQLSRDFDPPARGDTRYLNVHARFDEAGMLLRFWSFPTWLFHSAVSTLINSAFLITLVAGVALLWLLLDVAPSIPVLSDLKETIDAQALTPLLAAFGALVEESGRPTGSSLALGALTAGPLTVLGLVGVALLVAPFGIVAPWLLRRTGFAFGGEKLSWSVASDIHVQRRAKDDAEMLTTFLPRAWTRGNWQHNFYYQDPRLTDALAERMADWRTTPNRGIDVESWISWAARALFQTAILIGFAFAALLLAFQLFD